MSARARRAEVVASAYHGGSTATFAPRADDSGGRSGEHSGMRFDLPTAVIRRAVAAALLAAALLVGGCGTTTPDRDAPSGNTVTQDGVAYTVQISRALNPLEPSDGALLDGLADRKGLDGPDITLVGVFLQARGAAAGPRDAVARPQLVSASGEVFLPMPLPADDPFAYRARRLAPGHEIPDPGSPAAAAPENGAALIYRVPSNLFTTDRPFTLRFGHNTRAASVQLDL